MSDEEYSKYHKVALEIITRPSAKEAGVTYLDEGTHTFTLNNGAKFTVSASPYTPGSGGTSLRKTASTMPDIPHPAKDQSSHTLFLQGSKLL